MELWIILVIIAQLLNALVVVIDKYIVTTPELPQPPVYAFYVALLSALTLLVILPLSFTPLSESFGGVEWPYSFEIGLRIFGHSLVAGLLYVAGIIMLFNALKRADASDVIPVVGSASAVVSFFMGTFFFNDPLPHNFYFGFIFLVLGTALISHYRFKWRGLLLVIGSGAFIGMNTMLVKSVFNLTSFVDGYFWTRLGNVIAGLLLLLWPPVYYAVTRFEAEPAKKASAFIVLSKGISGAAVILILMAISQGSLPIINAMQGLQFVFLLVLSLGCTAWMPLCFYDGAGEKRIFQKVVAIGIMFIGFVTLFM